MERRPIRTVGRLAALAALALVSASVAETAGRHMPVAEAGGTGIPVVVGFLSPDLQKACVNRRYKLEYYVMQNYVKSGEDVPLAPLSPTDQVTVTFSAQHGTVFPATEPVGPFRSYGQIITRTMTYKATSTGSETLTITGTDTAGTWKNEMTFPVTACKSKVRGSADMTQVTSMADTLGGGLWTMVASLDADGEVVVGEDSITGSGTVQFAMFEQFEGVPSGVLTCSMSPPWQGSGDLTISGDAAALDDAQLALTLDLGAIPLGATRIQCSGVGGMSGGFDLPAGDLPAVALVVEPLPMEGGTADEDLPYGQFQLPFTVSVVDREVAS